jgi:hypothetical protein
MLKEIFLCFLYAAENIVRLLAGDQLDVPRTVPRKPSQPKELHSAHFLALSAHDRTCAAQRPLSLAPGR